MTTSHPVVELLPEATGFEPLQAVVDHPELKWVTISFFCPG